MQDMLERKKVKFFEFEDDVTEETIQEEFDIWVENTRTDSSWYEELAEDEE